MNRSKKRTSRFIFNKSRTNIYEIGAVIGDIAYCEIHGCKTIAFKLWTNRGTLKQVEAWYCLIGTSKEIEMNCLKFLQSKVRIAIQGERLTYEYHDIGTNQIFYRQLNIAKVISILGMEKEKNLDFKKEDMLLKLKSLDTLTSKLPSQEEIERYEKENANNEW